MDLTEKVENHEKRIVDLERCDAVFAVQFVNLCEKLDSLVSWLKLVFVAIMGSGLGFFIWYIQTLGR